MQYASAEYKEFLSMMVKKNTQLLLKDNERIQCTKNIFEDCYKKILELEDEKQTIEQEIDQKFQQLIVRRRRKKKIGMIIGWALVLFPIYGGIISRNLRSYLILEAVEKFIHVLVIAALFVGVFLIVYSAGLRNEGQLKNERETKKKMKTVWIIQRKQMYLNSHLCAYCGNNIDVQICPKCGGAVYLTVQAYINGKDRALEFFRDARPKTYKGDEIGSET